MCRDENHNLCMIKNKLVLTLALAASIFSARAQSLLLTTNWSGGFVNNGIVPDNDLSGLTLVETTTGWSGSITDLSVTLNMTGGWNGDIYAYLYHDGVMGVLLNQTGASSNNSLGYSDSGFNITLSDTAAYSIHKYQENSPTITSGVVQGTWQPDGVELRQFNGLDASGTWALFVADENPGGVMTVNSWGLKIESVPEPSTFALAGLGGLGMLIFVCRRK